MSEKNLYIHIGSPKTGTTALQNFFAQNTSELVKHDICYPAYKRAAKTPIHLEFSRLAVKEANNVLKGKALQKKSVARCDDFFKKIIEEAGSCSNILISGEELFYADDLSLFAKYKLYFTSIKIVVYLRRQDEYLQSLYIQRFKKGKISEPIQEHEFRTNPKWLNYYDRLKMWGKMFGDDNIIVRPFERSQYTANDLFTDFMTHAFKVEDISAFSIPKSDKSNIRVDADIMKMVQLINTFGLKRRQSRNLLTDLLECPIIGGANYRAQGKLLSSEEARSIIEEYDVSNNELYSHFSVKGGGSLFTAPLPELKEKGDEAETISSEKASQILLWLILQQEKRSSIRYKIKSLFYRRK